MAMPRFDGASAFTIVPSKVISPEVMSSSPAIRRSSVDLPQPDGPTKTMNSPEKTSRSTPLITSTRPKDFLMFLSSICAMELALYAAGGEAGNDLALEDEDEDDERYGDDHRRRHDVAPRDFVLAAAR